MSKRGIVMSLADVEAHQKKHGFGEWKPGDGVSVQYPPPPKLPKPRQNKTETEFGRILEAQKQRGEILEYRFEGLTLAWGCDPETGKPMRYTPDFYVVVPPLDGRMVNNRPMDLLGILLIEVKNAHIYSRDLVRFKGCRAEWPMFRFELHQKANGEWRRLL